ncbi:hypothetical protein HanIR_Chr14g0708091 [Helianthus annuus]|nr:hypothetical protein HanIR_Chr14g0708091 [Helianthus annuus]
MVAGGRCSLKVDEGWWQVVVRLGATVVEEVKLGLFMVRYINSLFVHYKFTSKRKDKAPLSRFLWPTN